MRNLFLLFIELVLSYGTNQRIDPNCPDYDLNAICHETCIEETYKCIMSCEPTDSTCIYTCLRAEDSCRASCPCDIECPNGCDDCENSICECSDVTQNADWNKCLDVNGMSLARCIYNCEDNGGCENECVAQFKSRTADCPCEENCPAGCPCDSYDCEDVNPTVTSTTVVTTTTEPVAKEAVLMLSTHYSSNVPMVIGYNGELDDDINFTYDSNTEVSYSCAASLNDEMWVLGGYSKQRQMSKVQDCRLTSVGELPFNFKGGGCNTFSFGIMLCFDRSAQQACHSFDGETFKTEASSKFPHHDVMALGSYRNSPFVTGHYSAINGLKTEILNYALGEWELTLDYPFSNNNRISYYATASTSESVLIIGGYTAGSPSRTATIAEYKDGSWKNVGNLAQARYGHGAITSGSITMVVGGYPTSGSTTNTELWEFDSLDSQIIDPTLSRDYMYGIGLFLVDEKYCSKN